jgi:hypothetical protein
MPAGMCLRFPLEGSSLSDPGNHGRLSLSEYLRSMRGPVESAIFASDDLFPGLCEIPPARLHHWRACAGSHPYEKCSSSHQYYRDPLSR